MDDTVIALERQLATVRFIEHDDAAVLSNYGQTVIENIQSEQFGGKQYLAQMACDGAYVGTKSGDTYYCSFDITNAIATIASSLPETWSMTDDAPPSPHGWMWLGNGAIFAPCGNGLAHKIKAVSWCSAITDRTLTHVIVVTAWTWLENERACMPVGSLMWIVNRPLAQIDHPMMRPCAMFIASFMQFVKQRIITTDRIRPAPRHIARRNRDVILHDPVVRVIELRAREHDRHITTDSNHRDYACQWIVRGHWRNQWYPSLGTHQPKWITPYVKGPDDKPLKTPRANVFAVIR